MREILFRGKRVDNGEWVYGFYNRCEARLTYTEEHYKNNPRSWIQTVENEGFAGQLVHVDADTVGQYTGLTDKNGNRVYENDILFDDFGESYCIVKFGKYASSSGSERFTANVGFYTAWVGKCQNLLRRDLGYWLKSMNNTTSVVGNIHDNPDMLTDKGEG